VVCVC